MMRDIELATELILRIQVAHQGTIVWFKFIIESQIVPRYKIQ